MSQPPDRSRERRKARSIGVRVRATEDTLLCRRCSGHSSLCHDGSSEPTDAAPLAVTAVIIGMSLYLVGNIFNVPSLSAVTAAGNSSLHDNKTFQSDLKSVGDGGVITLYTTADRSKVKTA